MAPFRKPPDAKASPLPNPSIEYWWADDASEQHHGVPGGLSLLRHKCGSAISILTATPGWISSRPARRCRMNGNNWADCGPGRPLKMASHNCGKISEAQAL